MSKSSQSSTTPVGRDSVDSSHRRRLVVMFDRFGPYHVARLNALTRDFTVTALECFGETEEYAWQKVPAPDSFQRVTLFPERSAGQCSAAELAARVHAALNGARPETVAIPGWFHPGARAALHWCLQSRVPALLMSESTAHDAPRSAIKEWIKGRIVGLFSAALVGGRAHADYLRQLGFPAARVFTGYDVVDNEHFARGNAEGRRQKAETSGSQPTPGAPASGPASVGRDSVEPSASPISAFQYFSVSDFSSSPYFLASARFLEKKNLSVLLQAYAEYRGEAESRKQKTEITDALPTAVPPTGLSPSTPPISESQRFSVSAFANAPWSLVILGDGPLRESLNAQLSSLNLRDSVVLPGFKQYDELPAWYAGAGAFVHVSTQEPWGLVVNEALAAGLPVLVSNRCGCAPDLVEEGRNGFTFDPTDARQLAALMCDMAQRPDREAMGRESKRIISRWSPAAFGEGMKAAVECARSLPPAPSLVGRVVLRTLLRS